MRDSIPILGKVYGVEKRCQDDLGVTDLMMLKIYIKSGMPKCQEDETLLHEVIESINDQLELKLKHSQISGLAVGLHSAGVRI